MKKLMSEKGSVSVLVIVAFIFSMTILISIYWSNTNYQIMALQAEQRIRAVYEEDVNRIEDIHEAIQNTRGD